MTRAEDVLPGPRAVIPALRCWRCGADCATAHRTIRDLGRDTYVCAAGCVPTLHSPRGPAARVPPEETP